MINVITDKLKHCHTWKQLFSTVFPSLFATTLLERHHNRENIYRRYPRKLLSWNNFRSAPYLWEDVWVMNLCTIWSSFFPSVDVLQHLLQTLITQERKKSKKRRRTFNGHINGKGQCMVLVINHWTSSPPPPSFLLIFIYHLHSYSWLYEKSRIDLGLHTCTKYLVLVLILRGVIFVPWLRVLHW